MAGGEYFIVNNVQKPKTVTAYYADNPITSITCYQHNSDDVAVFVRKHDDIVCWSTPHISLALCVMYSIPISRDGSKMYIPLFNGGIICVSTEDGKLLWKSKRKNAFGKIYVGKHDICCVVSSDLLIILNGENGEEKKSIRIRHENTVDIVDDTHILTRKGRNWVLLNAETLEIEEEIPKSEVRKNPMEVYNRLYNRRNGLTDKSAVPHVLIPFLSD